MTKPKILIVDDDLTALDIVDYVFEENGYEVSRSSNGSLALDSFDRLKPDVVLVDLLMPVMGGQECIRELRGRGFDGPVIAFTALDDPLIHEEARAAGADQVLVKPSRPKLLLSIIEGLLKLQ